MSARAVAVVVALVVCAACGRAIAGPASGLPPSRCGAPPLPAHADAMDRAIVRAMVAGHVPGLSAVVIDRGRVVKLRSYGFADLESCAPATEGTLFGIGSVSKQLAAVGVLTLVRDGALALDDPITKYLPEGKGAWDAIRVRDLLTHTSGIPDYTGDDDKFPSLTLDRAASPPTDELLRRLAKARLNFRPGDEWAYSNTAYIVLSVLVERVAHQPFPAFMHDRVFAPLGMRATRFYSPLELIPGRATPYHVAADGTVTHGPFISDQFSRWGDMGILSTAADMGRWAVALGRDKLLPAKLWQEMLTPVRLADGAIIDYGFGMQLEQVGSERLWIHAGTFRVGYSALLLSFPDRGLAVVTLSNHWGEPLVAPEVAGTLVGLRDPALAPLRMQRATADPQPRLTAALFARLSGADDAHGAIALTPRLARHRGPLPMIAEGFVHLGLATSTLEFHGCTDVRGTPPAALGAEVTRQCRYGFAGHDDIPGLQVWLTARDELAGISFW